MTNKERKGLRKLRKKIQKGEIVILKSDKSGRLVAMKKKDYLMMGTKQNGKDRKISRKELLKIEEALNDHTRMLSKAMNIGENHNNLSRILASKITNSENTAPKYYLYKDHKKVESWRPVVSGCSSNTLGLSNLLSEMIESVANAVVDPFEVISSEDLLSRFEKFNEFIKKTKKKKDDEDPGTDWDWRDDWMLVGSDVVSLFPSLTAETTA